MLSGMQNDFVRDFLQNRGLIFGFIQALTRDLDLAEEAFQEVGLRVMQQAAKGAHVARFLPWVREIARNVVADLFRGRARAPVPVPFEALIVQAFEENEMSAEESHARRRALVECLERLTERVRSLLRLRYAEGSSLDQAASAVGWSPDSVKVATSRARKTLLDCMQAKLNAAEA
jgi:RNA polymerase sigma-70 factor (ECF subfamily)